MFIFGSLSIDFLYCVPIFKGFCFGLQVFLYSLLSFLAVISSLRFFISFLRFLIPISPNYHYDHGNSRLFRCSFFFVLVPNSISSHEVLNSRFQAFILWILAFYLVHYSHFSNLTAFHLVVYYVYPSDGKIF